MSESAQYVTLGVAKDIFAAPVERVQEILDMRAIARLPHAPANLLGMIDVRGRGIPVLDLRLTLGLEPAADNENTRIIVLSASVGSTSMTIGLRTDRVFEVTVLDDDRLDPPPTINGNWTGDCIAGIGRRNGSFVTVFDLDRLLGRIDLPVQFDGEVAA